ncbi:vacuolar sorting protein 9 domain-containing protein [Planoprotostelium fungivorum]|uniref:Vacuolar sorting protein 9 domain-containing protein n=1 Tax=Planoprotostelium fungivorum TaxID=1890364 RepID=A0A2P6N4J5_9EUKA|nr:vacuolar sorting protein 9 domain-containing protein [Planoprotostelium fungivorum]
MLLFPYKDLTFDITLNEHGSSQKRAETFRLTKTQPPFSVLLLYATSYHGMLPDVSRVRSGVSGEKISVSGLHCALNDDRRYPSSSDTPESTVVSQKNRLPLLLDGLSSDRDSTPPPCPGDRNLEDESYTGSSMWSAWIFKPERHRSAPAITSKQAVLHRESLNEALVQRGMHLITTAEMVHSPDLHVPQLERAGLSVPEVQEVLSRLMDSAHSGHGDFSGSEYDPIYLLPPPRYEEFIVKLTSNTVGSNAVLKSLRSFVAIFRDGIGSTYSMEDKATLAINQTGLLTDVAINCLYGGLKDYNHHASYSPNRRSYRDTRLRKMFSHSVSECVEKCLMTKLHEFVFPPLVVQSRDGKSFKRGEEEDLVEVDRYLNDKIEALKKFVQPRHLDISYDITSQSTWPIVLQELRNMNEYKSPRDKLVCLVKSAKQLFKILVVCSQIKREASTDPLGPLGEKNADSPRPESAVSADVFLPALIFSIMQSNPKHLKSNAKYIQYFRNNNKMMHESGYLFVSFVTAVTFLERLNETKLSDMSKEEYETRMSKVIVPDFLNHSRKRASISSPGDQLLLACAGGDFSKARDIVKAGNVSTAHVKTTTNLTPVLKSGDFPLSVSCRYGNIEMAKYILSTGVDINMINDVGRTSLHMECMGHRVGQEVLINFEVIQFLLDNGARLDIADKFNSTPVSYSKNITVVDILLRHMKKQGVEIPNELRDYHELSGTSPNNSSPMTSTLRVHSVSSCDSIHTLAEDYKIPADLIRKVNNLDKGHSALDTLSHVVIPVVILSESPQEPS